MIAKVALKSATVKSGEQFAMISGAHLMLECPVFSWDMQELVRHTFLLAYSQYPIEPLNLNTPLLNSLLLRCYGPATSSIRSGNWTYFVGQPLLQRNRDKTC